MNKEAGKRFRDMELASVPLRMVKEEGTNQSVLSKAGIKRRVLKPMYKLIQKCSPWLAQTMRNQVYKIYHGYQDCQKHDETIADETVASQELEQLRDVEILVDSTETSRTEFLSGIQRVVRNLIVNFSASVTVGEFHDNIGFVTNNRMRNIFCRTEEGCEEKKVDCNSVRKLVLLDSSWEYKDRFEPYIDCVNAIGRTYAVVYDFIPICHKDLVVDENFAKIFVGWHDMILQKTDHVMCISKAVADDVISYYKERRFQREKPLSISYFPLGANLKPVSDVNPKFIRKCLLRFMDKTTFLMVGTVEPRKGHIVALQAFTKLLERRQDVNLLIIGRNGWKNDEVRSFIAGSKFNKSNILWLEDASDYELMWAYQKSDCLIAASLDEGYGLPLIEGAHYGIPIICSDIPVFREVSQGHADFFQVFDSDALQSCMEKWLQADSHPDSSKIRSYTWKEAADIFMEIVEEKREPYKILQ